MGNQARGLARLRFAESDIKALLAAHTAEMRPSLSVDDAAKVLGVKQETAYGWAQRGVLPTIRIAGNQAEIGRRISRFDLEEFQRRFITAAKLRRAGVSTSKKLAL